MILILLFTAPQTQDPDPVPDFSGGSCKEGHLCSPSSSTSYGMSGPAMMMLRKLSLPLNPFMPVVDLSTTFFLLSKSHKNKNKHLGGFIFLPADQFVCSGQTKQN